MGLRFSPAQSNGVTLPNVIEIDVALTKTLAANITNKKLATSGELTGKTLEMTLIHAPAGLRAARMLLVGAGKREKFDSAALRKISGAALRYLKSRGVHNFVLAARENGATEDAAQALAEGAIAADFESDKYKTDKKNDKSIDSVQLAGYSEAERAAGEKGLTRGRIIAEAQNFARDLINEPSNKLTPKILAEKAEAMAKQAGLAVEILDEKKIGDSRSRFPRHQSETGAARRGWKAWKAPPAKSTSRRCRRCRPG